jgi:tetratricopeptide (TPR) repeat protein
MFCVVSFSLEDQSLLLIKYNKYKMLVGVVGLGVMLLLGACSPSSRQTEPEPVPDKIIEKKTQTQPTPVIKKKTPTPAPTRDTSITRQEILDLAMKADLLESKGRRNDALELYADALKRAPESLYLLNKITMLNLQLGHFPQALESARQAVVIEPDNAKVQMNLGLAYRGVGEATMAEAAFERVIELSPSDPKARMLIAETLYRKGEWERAAVMFGKLLEAFPQRVDFRNYMGICYLNLKRYDEALTEFNKVMKTRGNLETYGKMAEALEGKGNIKQALKIYGDLARRRPKDVQVRRKMAELLLKYGSPRDQNDAEVWLQQILLITPDDEWSRHQLLVLYARQSQWIKAEESLVQLLKVNPNHPEGQKIAWALLDRYQQLFKKSKNAAERAQLELQTAEGSLRICRLIEDVSPDSVRNNMIKGWALLHLKQYSEADETFKLAIKECEADADPQKDKLLANLYTLHFSVLYSLKKYDECEVLARRALELDPDNEPTTLRLAELMDRGKRHQEMEELVQAYLKRHPDSYMLLNYLAYSYATQGAKLEAAEELARRALVLQPDTPNILFTLGWTLYRNQRFGEAAETLEKAIKNVPEPTILKLLGDAYFAAENYAQAQQKWELVLELEPDDEHVILRLASLYEREKRFEDAEKLARGYLERFPDSSKALNYLGYTYAERGINLEEAEKLIRKALEKEPDTGNIIDSLGWVLFKMKRYPEAIEQLEKAASLEKDAVILDHLGDAYKAVGRNTEAQEKWRESFKLDPDNKEVQEKVDKVNNSKD